MKVSTLALGLAITNAKHTLIGTEVQDQSEILTTLQEDYGCYYDEEGFMCMGYDDYGDFWWCVGDDEAYYCDAGFDSMAQVMGECEYDEEGWFCYGACDEFGEWWCAGDDYDYYCWFE